MGNVGGEGLSLKNYWEGFLRNFGEVRKRFGIFWGNVGEFCKQCWTGSGGDVERSEM